MFLTMKYGLEVQLSSSGKLSFIQTLIMLKTTTLALFIILLLNTNMRGQNLVPNPSFEDLIGTVNCEFVGSPSEFNNMVVDWEAPTEGSPDMHSKNNPVDCWSHCTPLNIYNGPTCFRGPQYPRTGEYMVGIQLYKPTVNCSPWCEYIQVQLTSPMIAGTDYYASLYYSLSDYSPLAVDKLGMLFSQNAISQPSGCPNLQGTPQVAASGMMTDITNWVKIEGTFTASANHNYLTIGNFIPSSTNTLNTGGSCVNKGAYYYIDDVTVIPAALVSVEEHELEQFTLRNTLVDDQLIVETNLIGNDISLVIFDVRGKIIESHNLRETSILDLSHFPKGLYLVRTTKGQHSARFIKK